MADITFSEDEIIDYLKRSELPTLLVEGRDDMSIYRWIESIDPDKEIDVIQCGGRATLLKIFKRRREINNVLCVFLADKDMWLFSVIPEEYKEIIFTNGYSIENDVLDGSCIINLLENNEKTKFDMLAQKLSHWFAFEVIEYRCNRKYHVDYHPSNLIPLGSTELDLSCIQPRNFIKPNRNLERSIRTNFHQKFRGKSLLNLYVRILNAKRRRSKYSKKNIIELSAKINGSKHTKRLARLVKKGMEITITSDAV